MSYFIGFDVGGTNMVCGLVDSAGTLIRKNKRKTAAQLGSEAVIAGMIEMIQTLCDEEKISPQSLRGVGVGTPGFIDPERGVCLFSANLNWRDVPLAELLSAQLPCPVYINNDVRMYVYGEAMAGAGQGYRHVLGMTLGTGIAAALVHDGQIYNGGAYQAGEIGHVPIDGVQERCNCGLTGCLETIASASGIARQAQQAIGKGEKSILTEWFSDPAHITAADVSRAYDADDEIAQRVMHYTGHMLGKGLSYAVTLFSPDIVVIGGGVAVAGERLFAPMREELKQRVHPMYWDRLYIKTASLLDDAGVIGSAIYAKSQKGNR